MLGAVYACGREERRPGTNSCRIDEQIHLPEAFDNLIDKPVNLASIRDICRQGVDGVTVGPDLPRRE